jgi:hypothetical protein
LLEYIAPYRVDDDVYATGRPDGVEPFVVIADIARSGDSCDSATVRRTRDRDHPRPESGGDLDHSAAQAATGTMNQHRLARA